MFHVIVYVFIHVIYILEQAYIYSTLYILSNTWLCIPSKSFKLL